MTYNIAVIAKLWALRVAFFCGLLAFALSNAHATALGTALGDLAANMQPGEFKVLNTNNFGGGAIFVPSGGDGGMQEYSDEALRNPITKKIYMIGCVRATGGTGAYVCDNSSSEDAKWIEYDENNNSWKTMSATPFSLWPHSYDRAALDPATGDYYYRVNLTDDIWRFRNGSWSTIPKVAKSGSCCDGIEYFPDLGGLVVPDQPGGQIHVYRPATNIWQTLPGPLPIGEFSFFTEYSAKHKLLFIGGGYLAPRVLLKMDATGKVTRVADPPVDLEIRICGSVNTIDPVSGNLVVFSCNGNIYSYDPVSNAWAQHGTHSLVALGTNLWTAAVPIPEHGVIFLASYQGGGTGVVYLYKHSPGSVQLDTVPPAAPVNLKVK